MGAAGTVVNAPKEIAMATNASGLLFIAASCLQMDLLDIRCANCAAK
jgi:hypothetical protein